MADEPNVHPGDSDPTLAPHESSSSDQVPATPRRSAGSQLTILAAILLVVLPIVCLGFPLEMSQWYVSVAVERRLDGNLDAAATALNRAFEWSETNPTAYFTRAEWRMDEQDYQAAVQDYDRTLQFAPESVYAITRRSEALQHLGRFDEAVEEWERLESLSRSSSAADRATFLNGLAYARSLAAAQRNEAERGKAELDQALEEIEKALILYRGLQPDRDNAALLDTRGYIRLLREELPQAEDDLTRAVEAAKQELETYSDQTDYTDERTRAQDGRVYERALAVIRYHRALLWKTLGEAEKAEDDEAHVIELGFQPGPGLF